MNHLVIMAGGVGSRFWPMSTPEKPKQFIDVLGIGYTLLQMTVNRFAGICPAENIWIVTSIKYREIVKAQLPDIPDSNILLEPCMRNTAPCIAYVAWKIKLKDPAANLVISPSDHLVMNISEFFKTIRKGLDFAQEQEAILTLGIPPTRPETGFGYIKTSGTAKKAPGMLKVEEFKEKPDLKTAESYLKEGGYYWNSGIFIWNVGTIVRAFRTEQPETAAIFDSLDKDYYTAKEQDAINRIYPKCKKISIDYAIMEHSENIYVLPALFGWSDLGTWSSLGEHLPKDKARNAVVGEKARLIESKGCIVHVPQNKRILIQGLEEYIVAEENGVMLICKKADEQRIRDFLPEN